MDPQTSERMNYAEKAQILKAWTNHRTAEKIALGESSPSSLQINHHPENGTIKGHFEVELNRHIPAPPMGDTNIRTILKYGEDGILLEYGRIEIPCFYSARGVLFNKVEAEHFGDRVLKYLSGVRREDVISRLRPSHEEQNELDQSL